MKVVLLAALAALASCSGQPRDMRSWLKERVGHKVHCVILGTESPPFIRVDHVGEDYIIAAPIWTISESKGTSPPSMSMAIPISSLSQCTLWVSAGLGDAH